MYILNATVLFQIIINPPLYHSNNISQTDLSVSSPSFSRLPKSLSQVPVWPYHSLSRRNSSMVCSQLVQAIWIFKTFHDIILVYFSSVSFCYHHQHSLLLLRPVTWLLKQSTYTHASKPLYMLAFCLKWTPPLPC